MKAVFFILFLGFAIFSNAQTEKNNVSPIIKKKKGNVELKENEKINRHIMKKPKKGEKIHLIYYSKNKAIINEKKKNKASDEKE